VIQSVYFYRCFIVVFSLLVASLQSAHYEQGSFASISDWIAAETAEILDSDSSDCRVMAERYLSRAESYLISGEYDLAFSDFQTSYELANLYDKGGCPWLLFQSLLGQAIVYGCCEMLMELQCTVAALQGVLDSCFCEDCPRHDASSPSFMALSDSINRCKTPSSTFSSHRIKFPIASIQSIVAPPIYGPDHISIRECIEFAQGTTQKCRYLISLVPKPDIRVLLNIIVDDLENRAMNCCRAGGLWKACIQPLVNKWYSWNQKWQAFAIPPDPAWD
jgi:hypothetical protein